MSEKSKDEGQSEDRTPSLIPIETIEAAEEISDGPFVPRALNDDPDASDASVAREGVGVSPWRVHTIKSDRLKSFSEPDGSDRKSRKVRRAHKASQKARSTEGRVIRGKARVLVGALLAILVASVVYGAYTYVYEQWGGKTVPYVVGMSQTNATAQLEEKGLKVSVETVPSDTMDGHVIEVRPAAGERVDEGSTVYLTVSTSRIVPEIVGMSREEARSTLEQAGAENIRFVTQVTVEGEDRVLEVMPAAGSVFMSSEEITVVVSQLPRMLDVVGEEEDIALLHLEREGISAQVQTERGTVEQRMRVIRTVPEAGQTVGSEGAVVIMGDPLIDPMRVEDYFDATGSHILEFLQNEGYWPNLGYRAKDGSAKIRFANDRGITISFVKEPWLHGVDTEQGSYSLAMDDSVQLEGVRLTIPLSNRGDGQGTGIEGLSDPTVGEATAKEVMNLCGLTDILGSCTQTSVTLPGGVNASSHVFYCCYGESAQHVWTVLIKGAATTGKLEATDIVVTCVPKSSYASIDLTGYGNSICSYVAYQDVYQ